MRYAVRIGPEARDDLFELYDYVAAQSGAFVASGYLDRIEAACRSLETMPERGAPRDDIRPGLRILTIERNVVIAFMVALDVVTVLRIGVGGRTIANADLPS